MIANQIQNKIKHLQKELYLLQNICKHIKSIKTPRADTGNYDPSCDRYWYDCKCTECGKFWTEDQ